MLHRKPVLRLRKRTAAIVAAVSVSGMAVAGAVVVDSSAAAPSSAVSQADSLQKVADLQTAASASASASAKAAAEKAAAAKAAAQKAAAVKASASASAAAKAAADKAAAQKAAAAKAAADKAAAEKAAAAKAAADQLAAEKAAAARAAAAATQEAASRSETRTTLSGSPQSIAAQIVPADQLDSFDEIISHESGWDVHATNASSGAYGLGQALPGSKMASAGSDWQDSAETQIRWALSYMNDRYGSPNAAWQFWQANNWY